MDALCDDIPALHWEGAPVAGATCAACPHAALRASGRCEPGRALGQAHGRLLRDAEPEVRERAAARQSELECLHG